MKKIAKGICPYCYEEFERVKTHLIYCPIRQHYNIINSGDKGCFHKLKANYESEFNKEGYSDVKINIRCKRCNLHIIFDTFERIWLPNINELLDKKIIKK